MNRVRRSGLAALLILGVSACTTRPPLEAPAPLSPAAERGRSFALRACGGCHALDGAREGPNAVAPAFASIRLRHTEISLERNLEAIAREGHGEMPPIYMTRSEIDDLVAYIETLTPGARLPQRAAAARLGGT